MKTVWNTLELPNLKSDSFWRELGELETKNNHAETIVDKYLTQTQYGNSSISIFQELFASIDKIFISGVRLGTRL